jgi:hypothetical protein
MNIPEGQKTTNTLAGAELDSACGEDGFAGEWRFLSPAKYPNRGAVASIVA